MNIYVRLAMCPISCTIRRVWHPGLCRVCRVGNSSAEQNNPTTDSEKIRCAPLTFIPFYAAPWLIGSLMLLLFGQLDGFGLMVMWVALLPYLFLAGYVVSSLTVVHYRTVFL